MRLDSGVLLAHEVPQVRCSSARSPDSAEDSALLVLDAHECGPKLRLDSVRFVSAGCSRGGVRQGLGGRTGRLVRIQSPWAKSPDSVNDSEYDSERDLGIDSEHDSVVGCTRPLRCLKKRPRQLKSRGRCAQLGLSPDASRPYGLSLVLLQQINPIGGL